MQDERGREGSRGVVCAGEDVGFRGRIRGDTGTGRGLESTCSNQRDLPVENTTSHVPWGWQRECYTHTHPLKIKPSWC